MSKHDEQNEMRDPDSVLKQVDEAADRFDAEWQRAFEGASPPKIEDYLTDAPQPNREALLRELIRLDLEFRYQRGESPTPADYVGRFPSFDAESLASLIKVAQALRAQQPPSPDSNLQGELAHHPGATRARRMRCPHCHSPIQLVDEQSDEVLCPGCGSSFRLRDTRLTSTAAGMWQLGKFQLLERLGLGAFGAVWKARDTVLDKIVALKIPHAGLMQSDEERNRFFREARAAAQLRHPGIVTVHEVAELETDSGKFPSLVSDFVDGVILRELLNTRRLTFRESAELIAQLADALDYAHSMGVVHRDMKPANVMLEYPPGLGLSAPQDEDSRTDQ